MHGPLSQNPLCLALSHCKSRSSRLDVGGMPHVSSDPLPHGLCSSPSSQRWSAPGGGCIPCHKSTFLHNRGTENGPQHSGSPRVSSSSPSLNFRPPPLLPEYTLIGGDVLSPKPGRDMSETWSYWCCFQDTAREDK